MATPSPRTATTRLLGSLALVTGLLVSTITLSIDPGSAEPHLLAALLRRHWHRAVRSRDQHASSAPAGVDRRPTLLTRARFGKPRLVSQFGYLPVPRNGHVPRVINDPHA